MITIRATLLIEDDDIDMIGEVMGVGGIGTPHEIQRAIDIVEGFQKVLVQFKKPDGVAHMMIKDFPSTERSNQTGS